MTGTPPAGGPRRGGDRWFVRPRVVLPIIAALVMITALLAPDQIAGRTGNSRLSAHSTEPQGAALLYELARRLGWRVGQRRTADVAPDSGVIQAVLSPVVPLRMREVHAQLEHVRHGGALLVVMGGSMLMAESLHVRTGPSGYFGAVPKADSTACASRPQAFVPFWPDNRVYLSTLRWAGPPPADIRTFLSVETNTIRAVRAQPARPGTPPPPAVTQTEERTPRPRAAAVGFPYGRGRIVIAADPDLVRNDVLRACRYGVVVPAVRMLEYLSDGGEVRRDSIEFDEYHQGFGSQPGTVRAIGGYLGGTASGHVLFQMLAAGLVLLLALAPRAIPPRDADRAERRSPLEHVDALARAYAQVGATRTATMRLLRGVRRRVEHGARRARGSYTDDMFLTRAQEAAPALAHDVALLRRALATSLPRREFAAVGVALHRLEVSLTRT